MRFAVHGPTQLSASPRSHGMPCRDVLCRIDVSIVGVAAGRAMKDRLALAVLTSGVPAAVTDLRRECGFDFFDATGSFVFQTSGEHSPAVGAYSTVQLRFSPYTSSRALERSACGTCHVPDLQSLDSDDVEAPRERSCRLLDPVIGSVGLTGECAGNPQFEPLPSIRARLSSRQPSLQSPQATVLGRPWLRCAQEISGGEGRGHGHSAVDADDPSVAWRRDGAGYGGECDVPALRSIAIDPVRVCRRRKSAPAELDPTDLGDTHSPGVPAQPTKMCSLKRDDAEALVNPRFSPGGTSVRARKVVRHGLAEVPQRLLLNHLRSGPKPVAGASSFRQLPRLFKIARRRPAVGGPVRVLLDGQIPHIASVAALMQERMHLLGCRLQTEPAHAGTVPLAADSFRAIVRPVVGSSQAKRNLR